MTTLEQANPSGEFSSGAAVESSSDDIAAEESAKPTGFKPTGRFWAIIFTCATIGLLSALENTVVTTALPQISTELKLGADYVWVTNVFFLTGAAIQPLFGQLANIYGRRWITLIIVAFFTLGSGVAGGANNGATLIAGRAVQGIGAGGIYIIIDIIVSDLVPLRQRGNYMAVILTIYTVGMSIGPWVGGEIIATTSWRWVFWINLPIGVTAMIMIFLFLHVRHDQSQSPLQKLMRIDYVGNLILIGSTVSILYALTYGGTTRPWSSARIISPLIIGFAGFVLFMWYERKVQEPVVPPELFKSRTAVIIFVVTFFNSLLLYWVLFFLPVYFQAVLGKSAARSGVLLLPAVLFAIPGSIVAVLLLTKFGKYKPIHLVGFILTVLGLGLFSMLDQNSSLAVIVIYQAISALGGGLVLNTLLPAVQAQLPESYQASVTAAWSFMRSFGSIWGVAVPAALLNERVTDPQVRSVFDGNNNAYENAYASYIWAFPQPSRDQIISTYSGALQLIWQISIAFAGFNVLIIIWEKQIHLRTELETEYGMEKKKDNKVGARAENGNADGRNAKHQSEETTASFDEKDAVSATRH
ncbi:DNA repair protein RAD50 [Talaromyces proteolyticus]|uniref:DNA repair protein RAD50 n=1 Tax=Talaromyces proteolyticus TaxID=1131652 RepID=A0AAD4KLG0_9EURO|nr:DNA repair protein RAD50 [Talaromyces proteolyticus]KAH8694227.1 DNA repair protein RAD50 [Talaromyces proteolyticus]